MTPREESSPSSLNLRIALHAGPVFATRNPVTEKLDYTSRPFAALAAAQGATKFACDYVGQTSPAKGYGPFPTHHARRVR
jgi:hypothetical protein